MTQITLVPHGGLCNRLRALLSVRYLADHAPEVKVCAEWADNTECGARFDELFQPNSLETEQFQVTTRSALHAPDSRWNLHLPGLLRRFKYDAQWVNFHSSLTIENLAQHVLRFQHLYISTGYALCPTPPEGLRRLKPTSNLQARIDALTAHFDEYTIGMHIRRTDNAKSIAHSGDDLFRKAIRDTIAQDDRANFFLATDDNALKAQLVNEFPDRIAVQDCQGSRANFQGMEEAVIDLYALSRTSRLLGSYWSSYTDTAAELGDIPLTILK